MKRILAFTTIFVMGLFSFGFRSKNSETTNSKALDSFYDFKCETLEGDSFDFAQFKGKKVLIVNTASKCGYTYQYEELQKLYDKYKDQNFVIVGFPSNNFGFQEPGSDEKIAEFCQKKLWCYISNDVQIRCKR